MQVFNEDWLAAALLAAEGQTFDHHDLVVEYQSGDNSSTIHHQVFKRGSLVDWRHGRGKTPDLVLNQTTKAQLATLTRIGIGENVLCATRIGCDASGWPPPLDEVRSNWGRNLPVIVTAGEFVVTQMLTNSPFGDVATFARVVNGQVVVTGVGQAEAADVMVRRDYMLALSERSGELDLLESLEGGDLTGPTSKLMLLAGWYESDECIESRRELTTPSCASLAALGRILSSPAWAVIGQQLAALSDHPH